MTAGLLLALLACATMPTGKDEAFSFAVEAVSGDRHVDGANASWTFLDNADPDDPRYDRGLRLLALSAEGLELRFAAGMIYRQIAQARRSEAMLPTRLPASSGSSPLAPTTKTPCW